MGLLGFGFRYTANELRRRRSRAILTALGLAAGVGLLIGLIGVSQGLSSAQAKVLSPLSSVGADVLVTRVAGRDHGARHRLPASVVVRRNRVPAGSAVAGGGGGGSSPAVARGAGPQPGRHAGTALQDNASLVTDLAKLGKPGQKFTRDFFLPATLLTFPQQAVT